MQIFEVGSLKEPPYMEAKEIFPEAFTEKIVEDMIDNNKVLILIDHNDKRIWSYYGSKSSLKLQLFGGILSKKFRSQLKLFYRIYNVNEYPFDHKYIQGILKQKIGPGKAQSITRENYENFSVPGEKASVVLDSCIHTGLNKKEALELLKSLPQPKSFKPKIIIIGGDFYSYDTELDAFITNKDEKKIIKKIGQIPNGFFFDDSYNYSIRFIIKNGKVHALEYYVPEDIQIKVEQLKIPIFFEEKFYQPGDVNTLFNSMKIPKKPPEELTKNQSQVNEFNEN